MQKYLTVQLDNGRVVATSLGPILLVMNSSSLGNSEPDMALSTSSSFCKRTEISSRFLRKETKKFKEEETEDHSHDNLSPYL